MTASRDVYTKKNDQDKLRITIPDYNYREGERKSASYQGAGWYIPSERRWENYNEHHELPRLTRRDALDFEKEKDFVDFIKKRDIPNYKKIIAYYPSKPPYVKWNEHPRVPHFQYNVVCRENVPRIPNWDGPGYYGYYQEILDRMRKGQCRRLARRNQIGYPFLTHQAYY